MPDSRKLTPDWAWATYEPDGDSGWNVRHWSHVMRRTGAGTTPESLQKAQANRPADLARIMVAERVENETVLQDSASLAASMKATGSLSTLPAWWLQRMLVTATPLQEKMTLLWHGHFTSSADKVDNVELMLDQNALLRRECLGNFARLTQEMSQHPAMLIYLDAASSRKGHPNENYAREVMELFVLGEGEYTEQDIRELSRCLTGWEVRRDKFRFNPYQHDDGIKTLFGQSGPFTGEEGINLVLAHPAGPAFVARKLVRFFVADDLPLTKEFVEPLAQTLRENNWELAPVMERILASNLFYSEYSIGRMIRSPIDFFAGFLRNLQGSTNLIELSKGLGSLGQQLFFPPNVKGWDGGRTWINSSTLLARTNLMHRLLQHSATRFAGQSLSDYWQSRGCETFGEVYDAASKELFAVPVSAERRESLEKEFPADKPHNESRCRDYFSLLTSLPEFQLG